MDELLVQYDKDRAPWWMLSDDGGDVVAMCSVGPPAPDGSLPSALVSVQWSFDAYGGVVDWEVFNSSAPVNRCGHKGLFADRLDGGVVVSSGGADVPRLARGAVLLYQDRNRVVAADLGRFLQVDPNATALALLGSETHHGRATRALLATLDLEQLHGDGANLYAYLRANPWGRSDPLGLFIGDALNVYGTIGFTAGYLAYELTSTYADNLDCDMDWAMDWDSPDEWNSRMDDGWVKDIYNEVNINKEVDDFVNPFSIFGSDSASVASEFSIWRKAARAWNREGWIGHHVVSWYEHSRRMLKELEAAHGFKFSVWSLENMLPLAKGVHGAGRHLAVYTERVFSYLRQCVDGKFGKDAEIAFKAGLDRLKVLILSKPEDWFGPP